MLEKGFLKRKYSLSVERGRIWFTILIAIAYSIAFYTFLIHSREVLRLFTFEFEEESMLILSRNENFFYNFFFASLASLTGFSMSMDGLIKTQFQLPGFVRHSIINDQTSLQWYVIFWFAKFGVFYSIISSAVPIFNYFDFYHDYWFLFPSILIVLFYNQWMKFRLFLKGNSRWFWCSGFGIVLFSGLMASLPIIDYESLNRGVLKNTISYNYKIELPKSLVGIQSHRKSLEAKIYFGIPKDSPKDSAVLVAEGSISSISLFSFEKWVINRKEMLSENEKDLLEISIRADRRVKLGLMKKIFDVLELTNTRKVKLVTAKNGWGIPFLLRQRCRASDKLPEIPECYTRLRKTLSQNSTLHLYLKRDSIISENRIIYRDNLKMILKDHVSKYPLDYLVDFRLDDESTYESYVSIKDIIYDTFIELRNDAAKEHFSKSYVYDSDSWENSDIQNYVRNRYPINIIELSDQERVHLEAKFTAKE